MRRRELARRLRTLQEKTGLNGLQLAEVLGWTTTTVSRTLTGHRTIRPIDVSAFLAICHVTGDERDRLLRLSESPDDDGVLRLPPEEQWIAYLAHAHETLRLVEFQPFTLPWMVQILEYTQAVVADAAMPGIDVAAEIATRHSAVRLMGLSCVEVFVHEWSLRNVVGDSALMSEQLHHLLRMSVRPSVAIRVVPIGQAAHAGRYGGFSLLEFADEAPAVYRESPTDGVFVDDPEGVTAYRAIARSLDRVALDVPQSRKLIAEIATGAHGRRENMA
jgi:transcriptional regulator with XRE-family HTH domain